MQARPPITSRPEILAPAGDEACLRAAIAAGADAVYFGLPGFNARARATNFDTESLGRTLAELHRSGVKGYVTLNTLVFDAELPSLEAAVRAIAEAGADAVIVQDLGVARLVRELAPGLPLHASTQMTCTDAGSVELARELGARRVILARELSLEDIASIRSSTDAELEVFVHGALCVAYSGQCLTSEAIGGRSANRGACAQACRLPYELYVDGVLRDLGDKAYLLSPQDLETSALVPQLLALGVGSLKIEGRLKGPDYVAATTRLYRAAVDAHLGQAPAERDLGVTRALALQAYSRGSGPGFLGGVDHQALVEARSCDHRGLLVGEALEVRRVRGRSWIELRLEESITRGDGLLVEGGHAGSGEVGGRVWAIEGASGELSEASAGEKVRVWLGPDKVVSERIARGRRVFRTSSPEAERTVLSGLAAEPHRVPLSVEVRGQLGEPLTLRAKGERGFEAEVQTDVALVQAEKRPLGVEVLREQLGRLGDSPFVLDGLDVEIAEGGMLPVSSLNRARRALVEALIGGQGEPHPTTSLSALSLIEQAQPPPELEPPPAGLFVLCRNEAQAEAALAAGADGVYLDFLELTGTGRALRNLRDKGAAFVGVAPPRIRKPGEEKIDAYLRGLEPDALLVRGLGALREVHLSGLGSKLLCIGDFSLNVANRLTAAEILGRGCAAFVPSFDLDAAQVQALLDTPFGPFAELVLHHPLPLFHMEHCVFAALLSEGKDHRSCGRPCEKHELGLRDRAGMLHPVEADVGCRNTVFHASAQSAAGLVFGARKSGVRRWRIELVRESAEDVGRIVQVYRSLLDGRLSAAEVFRSLRAEGTYGVVRGSLRVLES